MVEKSLLNKIEEKPSLKCLNYSLTRPFYLTSVEIYEGNSANSLSDTLYKSILNNLLSTPLQNLSCLLENCEDVKYKFLHTGLFKDISVTLDNDTTDSSINFLKRNVSNEYGSELPLPIIAKIKLIPGISNSTLLNTFISDSSFDSKSFISFVNVLGRAETLTFFGNFNLMSSESKFHERLFGTNLSFPLQKDPSIKAIVDVRYGIPRNIDNIFKNNSQRKSDFFLKLGIQKHWIFNKTLSSPIFFNGIFIQTRNLNDSKDSSGIPDSITNIDGSFIKNSFITQISDDARQYIGLFPINGYKYNILNEYLLLHGSSRENIFPQERNYDKITASYEYHKSYFQNCITSSFDVKFGSIIPLGNKEPLVNIIDNHNLRDLASLKGFKKANSLQDHSKFFYKLGMFISFKLPNKPVSSPLRLQTFLQFGDNSNKIPSFPKFSSTGLSLIYKTAVADMNLSYTIPLIHESQDSFKPRFSFSTSFSLF